jgi:bisanhydrobacterioruberin hydratase
MNIDRSRLRVTPPQAARLALAGMYAFLWAGGMFSYSVLGGPPDHVAWTAPLYLALAGALVFALTPRRQWHWPAIAAAIGFASEITGTALGVPYGGYQYTDALAPKLFGVPLVLTCAWLVLVALVQSCIANLARPLRALLGAVWMTAIDFLIDPLAAGPLGYWRWEEGGVYYGIPWTNFLGWFITSFVIFAVLPSSWRPGMAARVLGTSVIVFFTVIAFALGEPWLGVLGITLALPGILWWRPQ